MESRDGTSEGNEVSFRVIDGLFESFSDCTDSPICTLSWESLDWRRSREGSINSVSCSLGSVSSFETSKVDAVHVSLEDMF